LDGLIDLGYSFSVTLNLCANSCLDSLSAWVPIIQKGKKLKQNKKQNNKKQNKTNKPIPIIKIGLVLMSSSKIALIC
jgi:hypothetical protein